MGSIRPHSVTKVSCFLSSAYLSAYFDPRSNLPHLKRLGCPENGIEIRRTEDSASFDSSAFIAGPPMFTRQLHIPTSVLKTWLSNNWSKIQSHISLYRRSLSMKDQPKVCLALKEYFTETWSQIRLDANSKSTTIALGLSRSGETSAHWDALSLNKPTAPPNLTVGNWTVFTIDVILIDRILRNGSLAVMG
jgi:hypothetical protein